MSLTTTAIPQIRVFVVTSLEALEPYAEQWDQLALQAPQQLPMLSAAWVMAYLEHCLGPQESWRCYLATEPDGRLVGVLPIIKSPHPFWHSFLPILHTPWDWHTRSGDLLTISGMETPLLEAFLGTLREEFGSRFTLEMKGVRNNSPTLMALSRSIPDWAFWIKPDAPGSLIPVDKSFETYQEELSSEFKSNLRKNGRRLARMPSFTMTFLSGLSGVLSSLEKFLELEASGWKGKTGTAIACSSELKAFYCQMAKRLADHGWLELHFLEAEGKLIAGHFAVQFGSALVIPKIAYDEVYSKFSPGNILFERTVERAFREGGCREINLLADVQWHKRWKAQLGEYCQVYLFPRHPIPIFLGKIPKIVRAKLGRIQWIRKLYQRLYKLRKGMGENQSP